MEPITIIAIVSTVYGAASEIIGMNKKWESNSVIQTAMSALGKIISFAGMMLKK